MNSLCVFDYGSVDSDTKQQLLSLLRDINREKSKHQSSGLKIGKAIASAHEVLASRGQEGQFSEWVERECGFSRTTAYNYMWTWQRFGNCSTIEQFDAGALYALASPKAPPKAADEAEKLADKGHKITLEKAKELLGKFKVASDKPKKPRRAKATKSKPPSQSDAPAEPAPDSPDEPKISGGVTFNTEELTNESKDAFGQEAPEELAKAFELCEEFDEQRDKIKGIKSWITQRLEHPGAVVLKAAVQRVRTDLDQADSELKFARPFCVCVYCENKPPKVVDCTACKGLGWITEPIYKAAPKGLKREKAAS